MTALSPIIVANHTDGTNQQKSKPGADCYFFLSIYSNFELAGLYLNDVSSPCHLQLT